MLCRTPNYSDLLNRQTLKTQSFKLDTHRAKQHYQYHRKRYHNKNGKAHRALNSRIIGLHNTIGSSVGVPVRACIV